jgi:hypothetical protein
MGLLKIIEQYFDAKVNRKMVVAPLITWSIVKMDRYKIK